MNQQRIKTLQSSVDYAQKQLNELLKDIVIQVGDTVQILKNGTSGEVIHIDHDDNTYAISFAGSRGRHNQNSVCFISRKEPKPTSWYTQEEAIAFLFAHPIIVVRSKTEGIVSSAILYIDKEGWRFEHSLSPIDQFNFQHYEYSTDGKTWQSFGVEEIS